jgi:hypothetical protein
MTATTPESCPTCYGSGELVTEHGPSTCPTCFGDGGPHRRGAKMEWRLREIEGRARSGGDADLAWLVKEVRRCRELLLLILTRCHDAEEGSPVAKDVMVLANEALALYDVTAEPTTDPRR